VASAHRTGHAGILRPWPTCCGGPEAPARVHRRAPPPSAIARRISLWSAKSFKILGQSVAGQQRWCGWHEHRVTVCSGAGACFAVTLWGSFPLKIPPQFVGHKNGRRADGRVSGKETPVKWGRPHLISVVHRDPVYRYFTLW
jgi:hypothetical protein